MKEEKRGTEEIVMSIDELVEGGVPDHDMGSESTASAPSSDKNNNRSDPVSEFTAADEPGEPALVAGEDAEGGDDPVHLASSDAAGGAPVMADGLVAESEPIGISERLRLAGDSIDRASSEAEVFKRRRDKESARSGSEDNKLREGEKKRAADELKRREAVAEERRAALEYAESYRARIRNEKKTDAAKRRAELTEKAKETERAEREREIAEGIEREREEARARGERGESLLSRIDGSVSAISASRADTVAESTDTTSVVDDGGVSESDTAGEGGTPTPVSSFSHESETKTTEIDTKESDVDTAVGESFEDKSGEYIITVDPDAPSKDILYIGGVTACEIALVGDASPATAAAASGATAARLPVGAVAATGRSTSAPASASGRRARSEGDGFGKPYATPTSVDDPRPYGDYTEMHKHAAHDPAAAELDEVSSLVSAVKRDDIPKAHQPLATGATRELEESKELLVHADAAERTPYVATAKGGEFDITPKHPDPTDTSTLSAREIRRRQKAAREEEKRELLEFERLAGRKGKLRSKTRDERQIEEYESTEEARRLATAGTAVASATSVSEGGGATEPKAAANPTPVFDKAALEKKKKRQIKNDILLVEHRIYDEIRALEMDTRAGEISFTARIESSKDKRARGKRRGRLTTAKERLKAARRFEEEDNSRYYRLVMTDLAEARLPRRTDREELRALRERLVALLERRDELNLKLIDLYSLSEGGKGGMAQGRFKAELAGRKRAFKRQLPAYKKYEGVGISLSDKEKIYPLMDERTELYGDLARISYMLRKEKARGAAKKQLKRERRTVERRLKENKRAILHYEKKALKSAEARNESKRAAVAGWVVLGVTVAAAALVVVFWGNIQPWLTDVALPKLQEWFTMLVQWVTSLVGTGEGATPPTETTSV